MKFLILLALTIPFNFGYMNEDTMLYSDKECTKEIALLPATYFVIILSEEDGVYGVSYKDVSGFVKNIEAVDFEPVTKYASASFSVRNDGYPAKLRADPRSDAEVYTEMPNDAVGYYYGNVSGEELIEGIDKWYFVSYNDGINTYKGYVYSLQAAKTEILPNIIEKVEKIEDEASASPSTDKIDYLLIALLCVPSVIIVLLIFKDKDRKPRYD